MECELPDGEILDLPSLPNQDVGSLLDLMGGGPEADVCAPDPGPALLGVGVGVMSFAIAAALVFDAGALVRVGVHGAPR